MRGEDQFHTGIVVDDLDGALAELTDLFGYEWGTEFRGAVAVRLPAGEDAVEVDLRFVYSATTPRVEVIQSIAGTVWVPAAGSGIHHLGYWSDDVAADGAALERAGYVPEASGVGPGGGAIWSYHRSPAGARIELVDRALLPLLEQLWSLREATP